MFKTFFKLSLIFLFSCYAALGNAYDTLHVTRYSADQGLSQEAVRAIYQDNLGYIWLGTEEGLNRFDGKSFQQFRHQSSNQKSISSDLVYAIASTEENTLWIGTKGRNGGLNKYQYSDNSFTHFQAGEKADSLSGNNITALFVDSKNQLWIGTENHGLNLLLSDKDTGSFKRFNVQMGLSSNKVRAIAEDGYGNIWVGTDDAGVNVIEPQSFGIKQYKKDSENDNSIPDDAIRTIVSDNLGNIYLGTAQSGLSYFNINENSFTHYQHNANDLTSISNNKVLSIFQDSDMNIWVGTDEGLNLFKEGKFKRYFHQNSDYHSLSNNRILSIFQDDGDIVWVGTYSGLNKWNPKRARFNHVRYQSNNEKEQIPRNIITHFSEGDNQNILISTYGGGALMYNQRSSSFEQLTQPNELLDDRVMTSLIDRQNGIWLGTRNKGLSYRADNALNWQHFTQQEGLPFNGVTDILQDSNGQIWITTYKGGLSLWQSATQSFKNFVFKFKNYIMTFFIFDIFISFIK